MSTSALRYFNGYNEGQPIVLNDAGDTIRSGATSFSPLNSGVYGYTVSDISFAAADIANTGNNWTTITAVPEASQLLAWTCLEPV